MNSRALSLLILGLVIGVVCGFLGGYLSRPQQTTHFGNDQLLINLNDLIEKELSSKLSKPKLIKLFGDDTLSVFLGILPPGAEIRAHYHQSHDETVYVIKGSGR